MKKILRLSFLAICFISRGTLGASVSAEGSMSSLGGKVKVRTEQDASAYFFKAALCSALAGKIAYDIFWQTDYQREVGNLYQQFVEYIESSNIRSLLDEKLSLFFTESNIYKIMLYEEWVRDSYDSWVKPWNWTEAQRDCYKKIELLSMVVLYGPLLKLNKSDLPLHIIDHARKTCCIVSSYPLLHYNKILNNHISLLSKNDLKDLALEVKTLIIELEENLLSFKIQLMSDREYLDELYNFRTHLLLEEIKSSRN